MRPLFALLAFVLLAACGAPQSAQLACDDIAKQKCTIQLETGITMAYLEAGPADGDAVILLHGFTDSSRSWALMMRPLQAKEPDLHVFALDLRGHGASSMPPTEECGGAPEVCFRMADFAADVLAFMKVKGIETATLVGHSMGSFIAQEIALSHPDLVDQVVLVSTSTKVAGNPAIHDFVQQETVEGAWKRALEAKRYSYPADVYLLTPKDADPDAADWLAKVWDADPVASADLVKAIVPETTNVKLGTWIGAVRALLATDNTERLKSLSVPALVIWGVQDGTFLQDPDQLAIKTALDAAAAAGKSSYSWKQYGVIPLPSSGSQENDIGHGVPWDAPDQLAADIASFIDTGKPTPDLYRTDAPSSLTKIVTERGRATIVHGP